MTCRWKKERKKRNGVGRIPKNPTNLSSDNPPHSSTPPPLPSLKAMSPSPTTRKTDGPCRTLCGSKNGWEKGVRQDEESRCSAYSPGFVTRSVLVVKCCSGTSPVVDFVKARQAGLEKCCQMGQFPPEFPLSLVLIARRFGVIAAILEKFAQQMSPTPAPTDATGEKQIADGKTRRNETQKLPGSLAPRTSRRHALPCLSQRTAAISN